MRQRAIRIIRNAVAAEVSYREDNKRRAELSYDKSLTSTKVLALYVREYEDSLGICEKHSQTFHTR